MHKPGDLLLGRYKIIALIGSGSYGVVYLAGDLASPVLSTYVLYALKQLDLSMLPQSEAEENLELFEREVTTMSELKHRGIARFVDTFCDGSSYYIVMEYVKGETLDEIMKSRRRPFSPEELIPWALQIADILKYLHSQKPYPLIFRDLKPSNIMLTKEGKIKLIDFGISRYFTPGKAKDTFFLGTPGFSAPEQYGFGQSDPRSDIYSFGATLYYLLTGEDMAGFNLKLPPGKRRLPFAVPQWLDDIIMRCLSGNPGERFQSAGELRDRLDKGIRSEKRAKAANQRRYVPSSLIEIMIVIAVLALLGSILLPNSLKRGSNGMIPACKSNLKNIGTSLEMYSTDNGGKYPKSMDQVTPNYLKVIPTCASAGTQTYVYTTSENNDVYTVYCSGSYHTTICKANYPQYDSIQGLMEE